MPVGGGSDLELSLAQTENPEAAAGAEFGIELAADGSVVGAQRLPDFDAGRNGGLRASLRAGEACRGGCQLERRRERQALGKAGREVAAEGVAGADRVDRLDL